MKRKVFRVQWNKRDGLWWVNIRGTVGTTGLGFESQQRAIESAVACARELWEGGEPAQVVLHGKSGRIRWERTYGRDPKRSKG